MSVLSALTQALNSATVEVIDLTAPLWASTPVIKLPEPFGNTATFSLHEISRYDDRGPAWYWNDITTGEHTGTHFDAPVHWVTGRDGEDVSQVPADKLIAPGGGARLQRPGRRRPGLPAGDRAHQGLGAGARAAAGRRLAAVPDRLGRPFRQPGAVPERQRDRAAHAGHVGRVRQVGRRTVAGDRRRGRDRGHRRGRRALLRPAVPLPLDRCSGRASTASPSCRTWPGCRPPARW